MCENQSYRPPPPRAKRNSERFRNKSMLMVQGQFQSAILLRTLDEEEQAAKIVRGLWTSFCFCLCISFCNSLLLLPNVALFFFLCFFFPSSLHVIHSVFLRSFLSFFLRRYGLLLLLVIFLSFFLILWQLSGTYAFVGSLYLIFVAFPFFVKLKIQIEDQQEALCFFFFAWRRSEGERRERTVLRNLWR